jgi:hypothetical protein
MWHNSLMPAATFEEIKQKFGLKDETLYLYTLAEDGTLTLRKVSDYELLAEEGLRDVYDDEPEGLWERCLES